MTDWQADRKRDRDEDRTRGTETNRERDAETGQRDREKPQKQTFIERVVSLVALLSQFMRTGKAQKGRSLLPNCC